MSDTLPATSRETLAGVRMILRYNWPLYVAGLATAVAGLSTATRGDRSGLVRVAGAAAGLGASWLAVASLGASWWIYDRSELYRWTWLSRSVTREPGRVLVVHAGLDEASGPAARVWPDAEVESVDVHRGVGRTTASLRLARRGAERDTRPGRPPRTGSDVVVAFLAAHELRTRAERVELVQRIRDGLEPGGRLVLVEHVRDAANALAFGPAVAHFYPVREWEQVIGLGGLDLVAEERITPFVVVLTAERPA